MGEIVRYQVKAGSISAHCCFEATVVDTQTFDALGHPETICECFEVENAEKVADALNHYDWFG